ncbi:MAG: tetratricopeptide repeat protein, partial [Planctomycetota bacterium]
RGDPLAALKSVISVLDSKHVGPEAQLLYANILVEGQRPDEAIDKLERLLDEGPEIAGAAYALLVRILWESEYDDDEKLRKVDEYRRRAEELLPKTATAYFFRAVTASTIKERLDLLNEALHMELDHYESCRLRALTYFASRKYEEMKEDARVMMVLRSEDPLGYALRAVALRELGHYEDAIRCYDSAISLTPPEDPQHIKLYEECCETYLRTGEYKGVIAKAEECLSAFRDETILHFRVFCALIALGEYEEAIAIFNQIAEADPDSKRKFRAWSMKYVFDALECGRPWHPLSSKPKGVAFLAMLEAEDSYDQFVAKGGRRLITNGFAADWSPDGAKLAFGLGVYGRSGLATFDATTQEVELLMVPGKHPKWSPDGLRIAFVRDHDILPLSELVTAELSTQSGSYKQKEEVWIIQADGTEPRPLARGSWPSWSQDSKHVYYKSRGGTLNSISIEDKESQPESILQFSSLFASVSPDNEYVAYVQNESQLLKIVDLGSKSLVADWAGPPRMWWGGSWSPTSRQFSLGGMPGLDNRTGLWIYDLDERQAVKVLNGHTITASWAPDSTELAFSVGLPFHEVWAARLDPNMPTAEALGPSLTMEEHLQEMVDHYTRRIEAKPYDAESYLRRSHYYDLLRDKEQSLADMDEYVVVLNPPEERDTESRGMSAFGGQERPSDFLFSNPTNLGPVINSLADEWDLSLSADALTLVFSSGRPVSFGSHDLWMSTRPTTSEPWEEPVNLGENINTSEAEMNPALSPDGLRLYYSSSLDGPGRVGGSDIWVTERETISDVWNEPTSLGSPVNSSNDEYAPCISGDELELFFASFRRLGGFGKIDIWVSTRQTKEDPWSEPVNLGPPVNTRHNENFPALSADGLTLFFSSGLFGDDKDIRPGGLGDSDIWMTRRKSRDADWEEPVNLGPPVNTAGVEFAPVISADGSTLYFSFDPHDLVPGRGNLGWIDFWKVSIDPALVLLQKEDDVDSARKSLESDDRKEVRP